MFCESTQDGFRNSEDARAQPQLDCAHPPNVHKNIVLTIPAELEFVHVLGRCACALLSEIAGLQEAERTLYNLELAIQEIGVNIVTHAYADHSGQVVMTAARNDAHSHIIVTLEDTGNSFDPLAIPAPALGHLQEHGFGLFLAGELLDELQYEIHATGNCWRLKKSYAIDHSSEEGELACKVHP
ncbi:MAG: ATP-binding protein [Caldilineaceae bacterium]|nr:ATP-binding protein [Caldilineaceae bacterium]